jgi:HSP20 family molecular chaperone IbpA
MNPDIDDLLSQLEAALAGILSQLEDHDEAKVAREWRKQGLKVSTNISVRVGLAESLGPGGAGPKVPEVAHEPLVDVLEDERGLRLLVSLPGIRAEDVMVTARAGVLVLEVSKGDKYYSRKIRCRARPSEVRVRSKVENNSTVEIRFGRRKRAKSS